VLDPLAESIARGLSDLELHGSPEHLVRAKERLDTIGDVRVVNETLTSLRELAAQTPECEHDALLAVLLSNASRRVGVWVEDAAQWMQLHIAQRLSDLCEIDKALAATALIEAHTILYSRAMRYVGPRMPRERVRSLVEEILAASQRHNNDAAGDRPGAISARFRAKPLNLAQLLGDTDPGFSMEIRDRTLPRGVTAYGRTLDDAKFAPAVAEDRAQRIEEFVATVENGPSSTAIEVVESLVPFLDPALFQRCAAIVDRAGRDEVVAARAALALAAREPGRFHWAMGRCDDLDKWQRVPCAVTHAASFSGDLLAALDRRVLAEARARLVDRGTVLELCMSALVPEDEVSRVARLCEAIEASVRMPHLGAVRLNHTLIDGYLLLMGGQSSVRALRVALDRGRIGFREHLLTALQALGPTIRSTGTSAD
jgi:hypothetical protein